MEGAYTLPKPRNGDVFAFYMPGQTGCNINGGHQQLGYPGVQAEFLLMYDCSQSTSANPDQLATLESTMSHELVEAVTDDYGAWNVDDPLVNTVAGARSPICASSSPRRSRSRATRSPFYGFGLPKSWGNHLTT